MELETGMLWRQCGRSLDKKLEGGKMGFTQPVVEKSEESQSDLVRK